MATTTVQPITVPARGPIHLQIDVLPTARQCGVRYNIRLNAQQAREVRQAARLAGMKFNAFLQAMLNGTLPVTVGFLPDELRTPLARAVERSIERLQPDLRERIRERAVYHGHASMHEYLCRLLGLIHADDIVVHQRTGQPVGNVQYWRHIQKLLGVDYPQWVSDPLDYPGFLDRYPNRDPWVLLDDKEMRAPMEEICLQIPPVQLVAAAA